MASERYIENNVIRNRAAIGFADSPYIRRCRAGLGFGAADLVLLPSHGPYRIVIVEAKLGHSQDAAAKGVDQLEVWSPE